MGKLWIFIIPFVLLTGFGEAGPIRPRGRAPVEHEKYRLTEVEEDNDRREKEAEDDAEDSSEAMSTYDKLRASLGDFTEFEDKYFRHIDEKKELISKEVELKPKRLEDAHGYEFPNGTRRSVLNLLEDFTHMQGFNDDDGLRHKFFNVFERNALLGKELSYLKEPRNFIEIGFITNVKTWKSKRKWGERVGKPTRNDLNNLHSLLFHSKNIMYLVPILTKLNTKYPDKIKLSDIDDFLLFCLDKNLEQKNKSREDIPVFFTTRQSWAMVQRRIPGGEIEYQDEVEKEHDELGLSNDFAEIMMLENPTAGTKLNRMRSSDSESDVESSTGPNKKQESSKTPENNDDSKANPNVKFNEAAQRSTSKKSKNEQNSEANDPDLYN